LTNGREHPSRIEDVTDRVSQTKPLKAGLGQDERIEIVLHQLAQPGIDVAPNIDEPEIATAVQYLGTSAETASSDDRGRRQVVESAMALRHEDIAGRSAARHGRQNESIDRLRRQVLETVNGGVGRAVENGTLDFLGEDADAAKLGKRPIANLVAGSLDFNDLNDTWTDQGPERIGHVVCLPQSQPAAAAADA
jgi:hypothetical protein